MANSVSINSYEILKSDFITATGIQNAEDVYFQPPSKFIVKRSDVVTANTPINKVTQVTTRLVEIPFQEIWQTYFSSIPLANFNGMTVDTLTDATKIVIKLKS